MSLPRMVMPPVPCISRWAGDTGIAVRAIANDRNGALLIRRLRPV